MDSREAMKITLNFLFELLCEKGIYFESEQIKSMIEIMHDDNIFMDELLDFFESHIELFGENYGL